MNLNELLNIYRPYRTLIYLIETQASASAATWASAATFGWFKI